MSKLQLFDHYSLRARLQPALFTLLPLGLGIIAWAGTNKPWMSALWTVCGIAGATFFLAIVVRNRGRQIEAQLWRSWGGSPTTLLLRHSGSGNPIMRQRWHKYLGTALGRTLPTAAEEIADPASADAIYEAATKVLIAKTRDTKKYTLLYKENVSYGFCRNLYAMRSIGISIATIGLVASSAAGVFFAASEKPQIVAWVCAAINAVFLFAWIVRVTSDWVKVPGQAYADRLFESIESLSRAKAPKIEPLTTA